MAKKKDIEPKIFAVKSVTNMHSDLLTPKSYFQAKDGEYHMVKTDDNGIEIPNSDVSVPVKTYERTFSKSKNYIVKKSPK